MSTFKLADLPPSLSDGMTQKMLDDYDDYVRRHIDAVQYAGTKFVPGVPAERLAVHDQSKFTRDEFPHYARRFFGPNDDPDGFARAWLHHLHHNPHHWQHWIFPDGFAPKGSRLVDGMMPMPEAYLREMVADWLGAGYAITGQWDMSEWLGKSLPHTRLHPESRKLLYQVLAELGYDATLLAPETAGLVRVHRVGSEVIYECRYPSGSAYFLPFPHAKSGKMRRFFTWSFKAAVLHSMTGKIDGMDIAIAKRLLDVDDREPEPSDG